jgi:Spy/CpxP family protein refolding chaperone
MKRKTLCLVAVVTLIFTAVGVSVGLARPQGFPGFGPPPFGFRAFLKDLNLSDAQQDQIGTIRSSFREQRKPLAEDLLAAMKDLMAVSVNEQFNEQAVREAYRSVSAIGEELVVLRAKMIADTRAVLSEDQIAEIKGRMERLRERLETRRAMVDSMLENFNP